jgi:hypothetical protein
MSPESVTLLALVQAKGAATNLTSSNPFLDGQVVGVLGGTNGLVVGADKPSVYAEQRLSAFLTVAPPLLDQRASFVTAFEVDFGWGDRSYGVGGNVGGAFGADTVNLQTRRFHATVKALSGEHDLVLHAGLQFVPDGPFDPTTSRPDDLFRTSGRLLLVGSEAAGLAAYGRVGGLGGTWLRYRLGSFTLWESGLGDPDDTTLHVADLRLEPSWNTGLGARGYWLRDRSSGLAGTLGTGPTSALSEMQGGPRLSLPLREDGTAPPVDADVLWVGGDASINHRLDRGWLGASGTFVANLGRLYVEGLEDRPVQGALLDAELRARVAPGEGSVVRGEVLWSSADDPATPAYTGALTANSWGLVGALNGTHGTLLLMPDPFAINRYTAVVHDPSHGGAGVMAVTGSAGFDWVPNRLTTTLGAGHARSGSQALGTELNARVVAEALLFFKVGLHGGVVLGSGFEQDPWMVYTSLDWLVLP